jgi:hypothetical protein
MFGELMARQMMLPYLQEHAQYASPPLNRSTCF